MQTNGTGEKGVENTEAIFKINQSLFIYLSWELTQRLSQEMCHYFFYDHNTRKILIY